MVPESNAAVTALLNRMSEGETKAGEELLSLVYSQLRDLAAYRLQAEREPALQATELLHEAWLKFGGNEATGPGWENRKHFFGTASRAIRQTLVDHARARGAVKRGSRMAAVEIGSVLDLAREQPPELILALDETLENLRADFPVEAEVVLLRFFGGLTVAETADAMGLSLRQVERHWQFARAWLYDQLTGKD